MSLRLLINELLEISEQERFNFCLEIKRVGGSWRVKLGGYLTANSKRSEVVQYSYHEVFEIAVREAVLQAEKTS